MNRSAIDYDWPSTSLPAPSNPAQLQADPRLSIVNATEPLHLLLQAGLRTARATLLKSIERTMITRTITMSARRSRCTSTVNLLFAIRIAGAHAGVGSRECESSDDDLSRWIHLQLESGNVKYLVCCRTAGPGS
jgi:hypothetical protein